MTFHEFQTEDGFSDLVINYNSFKNYFENKTYQNESCLGPKYCIFSNSLVEKEKIKVKKDIKKIFVSFGGSDPADFTNEFIKFINEYSHSFKSIENFIIHIGPSYIYRDKISKLIDKSDLKITLLENVIDIHELMVSCDLAFSSGGNTMYELCYLGIPTFVIPQNDHQGEFATELANKGIVTLIGSLSHNQQKKIKLITQVMNNKKLRTKKNFLSSSLFDAGGLSRISEKVIDLLH